MKIGINKSAKRVLSIALALAMLVGSLFTANIGVNITAGAETATPIAEGTIDLLEFGTYLTDMGSASTYWDTNVADNGETGASWDDPIIIDSAEEFVYIAKVGNSDTDGKYFKVADGIAGFNLATDALKLDGTLADNLTVIQGSGKNHSGSTPGFQGHFDGNGVTVYGAWGSNKSIGEYAGLFSCTKGDVTIKNVNVRLSSFTASKAVGGIVGYHTGDGTNTLTIENCSVADCDFELTEAGDRHAIGALVGLSENLSSYAGTSGTVWVNGKCSVNNCYVNIDPEYYVSATDPEVLTDTSKPGTFGGVVGYMTSNGLAVNGCVVIGINPYTTQVNTTKTDIQHSGLPSHYTNIYTTEDVAVTGVAIGGPYDPQNFTGIHPLSTEQMQGAAAVNNMSLAWFSAWLPGEDGEYPTLNQTGAESDTSFWSGSAASEFAGGTGTKEDPYIIKTADQLYLALTQITDTTNNVAGGKQTDSILQQSSTDVYVPVYTPYYYKVADGVKAFYLNNVYGSETLAGAKAMAATTTKKDWKPGKSFVGHLDGNGVTIYGMYSSTGQGLVYKLDGSSTIKNINFDSCYSSGTGNVALLTTNLGTYTNDTTIINISNISVRNSYIATTRNITLTARDDGTYGHNTGAAGIVSSSNTAEALTISNCLYDGHSCERAIGTSSEAKADMMGAIISGGNGMNNTVLNGCVSLGAPAVDEVYVSGKEVFYNRYDANQGYPVHFYNCYSDMPLNGITTTYSGKYDKLLDIERIANANSYEMYDMPKLAWSNWALVEIDGARTIPMPTVNTAEEIIGSYVSVIAAEAKTNKYSGVGPYVGGTNPYGYTLKGSGTEADPYIIETDVQLARAIATGGMNLYDKLYYKLGNDIDISGGTWLTQDSVSTSSASYTYTPFGGTLDGDGHTITGLTAGDSASAGLIPILAGGTVKNLHVRNATVVSNGEDSDTMFTGDYEDFNTAAYAGAIVGKIVSGEIIECSAENAEVSSPDENAIDYNGGVFVWGYHDEPADTTFGSIENCYFIDGNSAIYAISNANGALETKTADDIEAEIIAGTTDKWYIGGAEGSVPRLKAMAEKMDCADVDGDGIGSEYGAADLTALRNNLLKKSAYQNVFGDVSRNGETNIADLAVLQRIIVDDEATITDSFFRNVQKGTVKIYYGENDNYDAARKVELYLENLLPGVDVVKCVSSSKGTVTGANSDSSKVYLHAGDEAGTPDGKLEIIVGNIDNYSAYATNTVATGANTYAVTYDATNKVVWLQGNNFTAVEQAAINFTKGCSVQGDVVYTVGSTVLDPEKQPITVKLDKNYDGTPETDTVLYYAWGDEFEEDTVNTNNWQHNSQQSEGTQGKNSYYWNQEIAPVKDINKVITVTNGRLSMKRGYDRSLGTSTNGTVALDVTPGEENGYSQWTDDANGANAIDTDGTDQYFSSGKITTERGMLYKQGYIEFQGQLPADGHAFPAWWLMGRPAQSQTNSGYDNSLFGKVYKLNTKWNGSASYTANNLDTYKYQIPSAIYEIDMIEVMQHASRYGAKKESTGIFGDGSGSYHDTNATYNNTKAVGWYQINSTIHKWWNNGVADDLLYIQDWDKYKVLNANAGITNSAFSTTSTAGSWIHNIGSTVLDFGSSISSYSSWGIGYTYYDGSTTNTAAVDARNNLQATRKYGFSWNTNGVDGFEATLYVYNTDGTLWKTVPIASGMSTLNAFKDKNGNTEANGAIGSNASVYSDAKVFNQYMYILLDNKFYSSNYTSGSPIMFTDLLTAAGLTSLEVDYVRVYQEDGARDIVTKETQAFNNNNHFGYN